VTPRSRSPRAGQERVPRQRPAPDDAPVQRLGLGAAIEAVEGPGLPVGALASLEGARPRRQLAQVGQGGGGIADQVVAHAEEPQGVVHPLRFRIAPQGLGQRGDRRAVVAAVELEPAGQVLRLLGPRGLRVAPHDLAVVADGLVVAIGPRQRARAVEERLGRAHRPGHAEEQAPGLGVAAPHLEERRAQPVVAADPQRPRQPVEGAQLGDRGVPVVAGDQALGPGDALVGGQGRRCAGVDQRALDLAGQRVGRELAQELAQRGLAGRGVPLAGGQRDAVRDHPQIGVIVGVGAGAQGGVGPGRLCALTQGPGGVGAAPGGGGGEPRAGDRGQRGEVAGGVGRAVVGQRDLAAEPQEVVGVGQGLGGQPVEGGGGGRQVAAIVGGEGLAQPGRGLTTTLSKSCSPRRRTRDSRHRSRACVARASCRRSASTGHRGHLPARAGAGVRRAGAARARRLTGYGCAGASATAYGLICQELERGDSGDSVVLLGAIELSGDVPDLGLWLGGAEAALPAEMAEGRSSGASA
jgi:hypothetical protein